ncbi:MAG: malonyl-ACP O-methyltransferase BioC [Gammaproteobacteria bacterium]|nr:malonyl-ACP O-methyltransferase BioC [Gammaproteobacteria bacterium]
MMLDVEYLPASGIAEQHLVLLHGWGGSRDFWRPMLCHLRQWAHVTLPDLPGCSATAGAAPPPSLEHLLAMLLEVAPAQAVYVGHSLGGKLALEMARRFPERVVAAVGVCCNPQFVADNDWPGMAQATFDNFRQRVAADAPAALATFSGLQALGTSRPGAAIRALRQHNEEASAPHLLRGLEWLAGLDQRSCLASQDTAQAYLFAEGDALVPSAAAASVQQHLSPQGKSAVFSIANSGHLLPWAEPALVANTVHQFLAGQGLLTAPASVTEGVPKGELAASFSRAAGTYDSVAALQREVGQALFSRLDGVANLADTVLDLGCGTGFFAGHLQARFPGAGYLGLDIAPGMVGYARARAPANWQWIVADAEDLPLASASVDVIFSSLAMQWCSRPQNLFAELRRVLKPEGKCVFTTLGPETLRELRAAWAAVDAHQHVNEFMPVAALQAAAETFTDATLSLEVNTHTMLYQNVRELLDELKSLGAHNMNAKRQTGLTGRRALQGMLKAYESFRDNGKLPATYEVIYGVMTKHE